MEHVQMLKIESTALGSISHGVGLGVLFNITGGINKNQLFSKKKQPTK